ncbi:hypothetical protein DB88DRAFT_485508 [Papiliotrema laurentii]|uniref:Uncharacterized protein n=1 Tax=Papiliotrema laurentii TaxID=5418 RepID=A0AAD9FTJ5_PAPLA|nr:hypothetical protein DB88DRAFT_485508 [Papiliotrema laurentii]
MSCSGNPKNCDFCGQAASDCAKSEVSGCAADPQHCAVCKGAGCVAMACTGYVELPRFHRNHPSLSTLTFPPVSPPWLSFRCVPGQILTLSDVKTCKTCMGNFQSCRKAEVSATEGIERARPADA